MELEIAPVAKVRPRYLGRSGKIASVFSATAEDVSIEGVAVYSSFRLAMCFS